MNEAIVNTVLLGLLVLAAMWAVMTARLLRAIVGLAVASVALTVLMFQLNSPLAAVFELSICAGLIPAIFLIAINWAKRISPEAEIDRSREQVKRFWPLPVIVVLAGIVMSQLHLPVQVAAVTKAAQDVSQVLWTTRGLEILGLAVLLFFGGAFAVVALAKEPRND
ncbi:MAG: hypothetical protein ACE15C_09935 [Phycisphaerae bacterium]